MRCPYCGSVDDKVVESRTLGQGDCIRRRRECLSCGYRFTSYERIEEKPLMVIKRNGRREPFDRSKRPVSMNEIENIVSDIEDAAIMNSKGAKEIKSTELGEMVLSRLHSLDKVAYIRFASVYKKFNNLDEFINEVKKIHITAQEM